MFEMIQIYFKFVKMFYSFSYVESEAKKKS